jgi:hypothetical protein
VRVPLSKTSSPSATTTAPTASEDQALSGVGSGDGDGGVGSCARCSSSVVHCASVRITSCGSGVGSGAGSVGSDVGSASAGAGDSSGNGVASSVGSDEGSSEVVKGGRTLSRETVETSRVDPDQESDGEEVEKNGPDVTTDDEDGDEDESNREPPATEKEPPGPEDPGASTRPEPVEADADDAATSSTTRSSTPSATARVSSACERRAAHIRPPPEYRCPQPEAGSDSARG